MACNICNSTTFNAWRGRANEQCAGCGALARHRVALEVYSQKLFSGKSERTKVLHLAPEPCLHPILQEKLGGGYICADPSPQTYPHAQCLKLFFPDDFRVFPENYFDAILHNHVLEHIPGHYGDHLNAFARLLKPGGRMIFSIPGPYMDRETVEGGEHLTSDAERLEKFLQEDHFKLLGADFVEFVANMEGGVQLPAEISDVRRKEIQVRPKKAPFFIWQKGGASL